MRPNSKANVPDSVRNQIAQFLLSSVTLGTGNPAHGKINEAARKWGINRRTVSKIWSKAKRQIVANRPVYLRSKMRGSCRPSSKIHIDKATVMSIKPKYRKSITTLHKALNAKGIHIGRSTVGKYALQGIFNPHTNTIKPDLTDLQKLLRLKFSLRALQVDRNLNVVKFKSMKTTIHIDEKWFYISQATTRYYMVEGEEPVYRSAKSKNHMTQVMFVCAVGRPHYEASGELIFDGKIGMYPLTLQIPAKRKSKNRPRGTLETKAITSVTREVYKSCLIDKIIPSIKAKWPANASKDIILQQDNAKPHISNEDPDFRRAASADGFNINLVNQPAQSPDCNVNDLGWFRAIQSLQQESPANNIDELVEAVMNSFTELAPMKLNKVFLSLQCCMVEIMKTKGHNKYTQPHMKKDALIRQGMLPDDLEVDEGLVRENIDYLVQLNEHGGLEELMEDLGY